MQVSVLARTRNLERHDLFLNGRPQKSLNVIDGDVPFMVMAPSRARAQLLVEGYAGDRRVAAHRLLR